uniref:Uncharacterized protein n=1 Tax=Meloidogyne enterolobii TaxID=390850 RepID=A0A6V7TRM8_MELEN|nr:unnamed protein product [Meloidogyne enterolobii]
MNEGNRFPKIYLEGSKLTRLYDLVIKHIITSKDCSKMVPNIVLDFSDSPNFKLSERAEKIGNYQLDDVKFTNYQISNIYNPKLRFSLWKGKLLDDGSIFCFEIRKIEE